MSRYPVAWRYYCDTCGEEMQEDALKVGGTTPSRVGDGLIHRCVDRPACRERRRVRRRNAERRRRDEGTREILNAGFAAREEILEQWSSGELRRRDAARMADLKITPAGEADAWESLAACLVCDGALDGVGNCLECSRTRAAQAAAAKYAESETP